MFPIEQDCFKISSQICGTIIIVEICLIELSANLRCFSHCINVQQIKYCKLLFYLDYLIVIVVHFMVLKIGVLIVLVLIMC